MVYITRVFIGSITHILQFYYVLKLLLLTTYNISLLDIGLSVERRFSPIIELWADVLVDCWFVVGCQVSLLP